MSSTLQNSEVITLDLRGKLVWTTKATLLKKESRLKSWLISHEERNSGGPIMIDRSHKTIYVVFDYLADGTVALPASQEKREQIAADARFYELSGLVELCANFDNPNVSRAPSVPILPYSTIVPGRRMIGKYVAMMNKEYEDDRDLGWTPEAGAAPQNYDHANTTIGPMRRSPVPVEPKSDYPYRRPLAHHISFLYRRRQSLIELEKNNGTEHL